MLHIKKFAGVLFASASFLAAQIDPPGRIGRLNYMDGPVSFQPAGVNEWIDASLNRPLTTDDNIWVGDRGRAEFHVGSTALRLGPDTAFQFLNLDDRTVQIRLSEGTLTVRLRNLRQDEVFEIDTPNLAFNLLRPGEYRIDANPDSQTTVVIVRDGEGDVTGGGQAFPVYGRQQVVVRGDDQITYNLGAVPGLDAWDQWTSSRDQREDRSQSARYVSREVAGYDDLDQYGRWDNQPGYGNVWMPTSVAAGWAPYHDGNWVWIAPWGWTWVDEAPWGFAPSHYGRWASFNGRWGWVPGPYGVEPIYAPALVGWVGGGRGGSGFSLSFSIGTAAAVGWFPLGPREPYFPSYQSSQGYFTRVNTTNTVINTVTINNYYSSRNSNNTGGNIAYANRNVQNGVTAVPQSTFARGGRVSQNARFVPPAQVASVQVMAAPAVAPQRESVLGARADTASRAPRPPANVLTRPVVARTAPPPAAIPFDRQQPALAQNPGRPLAPAASRGNGQNNAGQNNAGQNNAGQNNAVQNNAAPGRQVRVMDMGRVRRVQPAAGAGPQGAPPNNPAAQQPAAVDRQNGPPGQRQRQAPPAQVQLPAGAAVDRPQPQQQAPAVDRQNGPPGRQRQQQQAAPQTQPPPVQATPTPTPQPPAPQPPVTDRQNGPPGQRGRQAPPPQVQLPQQAAPPAPAPQLPAPDRQKGPPGRQRQTPDVHPTPERPQPPQQAPPVQAPPPQVDRQKGQSGRQQPQQQAPPAPPPAPVAAPAAPPQPPPPAAAPEPGASKQNQDKGRGKGKGKQDDN